ncbi:MAG: outer membrane protein transport protein [Kofleriaceae bacterium]
MTRTTSLLVAVALTAGPALASAGGMYLPTRGVRPTARAGAFIAGADDVSALWFNPAGLAQLHRPSFLADAGFVHQAVAYDRIDSGGNPQPTVTNQAPGLPVPSLGYAHPVGDRVVVAGGVWAPYAGLAKFAADGPQRYSSVDMSKSLIVTAGVGVAVRLGRLRLGATLQDHLVALTSDIVLSGCPGQTVCAPEDPEFDSYNRIEQRSYFQPSGSLGVQYDATARVTVGAAVQLPVAVAGQGTLASRLPDSGFFNGAAVEGDRADISLTLPAALRAGVEVRPGRWRVEAAVDVELWGAHDEILIEPKDVRIVGAPGVGTYEFGPIHLPRKYRTSYALQLGVEGRPSASLPLTVRAGYSFETAAAPDAYLSVLTVDGAKHLVATGLGYRAGSWTIDGVVGFAAMGERHVDPTVGVAPQVNPIRDTSAAPLEVFVNWGDYRASWLIAGLGVARDW